MKGKRKITASLLILAIFGGIFPKPILASSFDDACSINETATESEIVTSEEDIDELKDMLYTVSDYIGNENLFDEESAINNNESEDVIAIGQAYNEMMLAEIQENYDKNSRIKRAIISGLTHYGNWCGKGNNGKAPIDILDAQCQKHDKCYAANGMWNTNCDIQFVHDIARNFGAIKALGAHSRTYAVAAIMVFATKAGGTAVLKAKYPMLAPFLP